MRHVNYISVHLLRERKVERQLAGDGDIWEGFVTLK